MNNIYKNTKYMLHSYNIKIQQLNGIVKKKIKLNLSSFTHLYVIPKLYNFLSTKDKKLIFELSGPLLLFLMSM